MVKSQLRTIEGSGKIIIPIEHQYFQVGIFTHRVGQVDPCIGRYREAWSSVRDMCPVPLEAFRAVGRYMIIQCLTYFQLRIEIAHEGSDIRGADLRALRIVVGELAQRILIDPFEPCIQPAYRLMTFP